MGAMAATGVGSGATSGSNWSKALLKVGYACNNRCVFCHSESFRVIHPELTTRDLQARILEVKARGVEMVVFSGGEPTLRSDISELARFAHQQGLKTGFITNGRRFAYPSFVRDMRACGLRFVYTSFHSPLRRAHESSSGADSLTQVLAALRHLSRSEVELTVNTVVTRHNIGSLSEVVDLLAAFAPARIKFSVVEPKGAALENPTLCPPLKESAAAISDAIRYGESRHPNVRFACEGLTPCLIDDFDRLNDDLVSNGFVLFQETFESRPVRPDYGNRAKAAACWDCARHDSCPGVFQGYLSSDHDLPIQPRPSRISNSFVFLRGDLAAPPRVPAECSLERGDVRGIFVAEGNRLRSYRTPTSDFSDAEIAETLRLGQVYKTRGAKHKGLEYGRDLVKYRVSRLCRSCDRRVGCSRIYERSPGNAFAPLESALEDVVRGLRGDILEVGCGNIRFRSVLEALVRAGRMRYVGIDPHLPRMAVPRGMSVRRVDIEDFDAAAAAFDHILISRSYNHIRLPSVAFPKIRRLLRAKGRLTVVDGVSCGILLPRRPPEASASEFQHYRNHSSGQAKEMIASFGFSAVREIPVDPGGGSEWLLSFRKKSLE